MPAAFPLAVNVGIKRVRHRFGGCRAMKESPRMASEVSKDFQSNLLMSLNHQKCARSQIGSWTYSVCRVCKSSRSSRPARHRSTF